MSRSDEKAGGKPRGGKSFDWPLLCPVCGERLEERKAGRTSIDVCEAHGIWLDCGELEAIVRSAEARGLASSRRGGKAALAKARKSGKLSGWIFGPLSFLWD